MPTDLPVGVAEGFEGGDLFALGGDEAGEDDVEQECCDEEEDGGRDDGHAAQLAQFVGDELVRRVVGAAVGAEAAVGIEQCIEAANDFDFAGARHEDETDVVEGAFHVEGGGKFAFAHPEDGEALFVWQDIAGANLVDVFGAERDADDAQDIAPAVDDGLDGVAGVEVMHLGEGLADEHLAAPVWLDVAAFAEIDAVDPRLVGFGHGDDAAQRGFGEIFDVEIHIDDDARVELRDAGDRGDLVGKVIGRALELGEDVGEGVPVVIGVHRLLERGHGCGGEDEGGDAAGHDERDRGGLPFHRQQVADEFAMERCEDHGAATTPLPRDDGGSGVSPDEPRLRSTVETTVPPECWRAAATTRVPSRVSWFRCDVRRRCGRRRGR